MRAKGPPPILLPDADKDIDTEGGPYDDSEDRAPFNRSTGFKPINTSPQSSNYQPTSPNNNNHDNGFSQRSHHDTVISHSNYQNQRIQNNILRGYEPPSESPPPLPQLLFESTEPSNPSSSSLMTDSLVGSMFSFSETERSTIINSFGSVENSVLADRRDTADLNSNTGICLANIDCRFT